MKGFENPEACLERAAEAIKAGTDIGLYKGHLCFFNGTLAFRQNQHTLHQHRVFMNITTQHTQEGFALEEWKTLQTKLWTHFKELI